MSDPRPYCRGLLLPAVFLLAAAAALLVDLPVAAALRVGTTPVETRRRHERDGPHLRRPTSATWTCSSFSGMDWEWSWSS